MFCRNSCHCIYLPRISNCQSQTFNHVEKVLEFFWAKIPASSKDGMKRVRKDGVWQMWAPQKAQSSNTCLHLFVPPCSICCWCSKSLLYLLLYHNTNGPILLLDHHEPEGFYKLRQTVSPQTSSERMATVPTGTKCKKARLQKRREWWIVSGAVLRSQPRRRKVRNEGKKHIWTSVY